MKKVLKYSNKKEKPTEWFQVLDDALPDRFETVAQVTVTRVGEQNKRLLMTLQSSFYKDTY